MIFYVNVAHVRNTAAELKPNVWEIYDSKTVISTLRFPAMLDYGKDWEEFAEELKLMKVIAISS